MWFVQPDSYSSAILAACTDSATMNTSPDMSNKSSMLTSSFSRLENSSSTSLSSSSLSERLNNSGKSSCTPNSSSTDTKFEQREEFPSRSSSATASSNQSDSSSSLPSGFSVPTTSSNQSATSPTLSASFSESTTSWRLGTNLPHHPQFHQLPMLPRRLMSCRQRLLKSPLSLDRVLLTIHCPWTSSVCRTSN